MTLPAPSVPSAESGIADSLPEDGVWLFVLGDLIVYSVLFVLYASAAASDPDGFSSGQALLSTPVAVVNTLVLLTSSWLVARAMWSVRARAFVPAVRFLQGARACALVFIGLKVTEYGLHVQQGYYLTSSDFLMYYYVLTGLHLVHVLVGTLVLTLMLRFVRSQEMSSHGLRGLGGGAVFWHLVDLLWLMLFPLLYLVR